MEVLGCCCEFWKGDCIICGLCGCLCGEGPAMFEGGMFMAPCTAEILAEFYPRLPVPMLQDNSLP